jgi:hemerythrin-like domain-containing protein
MDSATAILRAEHDAILKMLAVTDEVARRLQDGKRVAPDVLTRLLEFFKLFADKCHHGKEEDLLFPLLEQKGMPRDGGPVGCMLEEHDQGRALIGQMSEAAEAYAQDPTGAGLRWTRAARGYTSLLESHIDKENNVLFRMAERMLSAQEQHDLAASFAKVEAEKLGTGTRERLHAMVGELVKECPPPA